MIVIRLILLMLFFSLIAGCAPTPVAQQYYQPRPQFVASNYAMLRELDPQSQYAAIAIIENMNPEQIGYLIQYLQMFEDSRAQSIAFIQQNIKPKEQKEAYAMMQEYEAQSKNQFFTTLVQIAVQQQMHAQQQQAAFAAMQQFEAQRVYAAAQREQAAAAHRAASAIDRASRQQYMQNMQILHQMQQPVRVHLYRY